MDPQEKKMDLSLDPEKDKERIEAKIIERIEELLPGCDHEEVVNAVVMEYEELLAEAKIKMHIPTLVEKLAKDDVRHHSEPGHRHHGEAAE